MVRLNDLIDYTQQFMQVDRYKDYCPNGLQVEGRAEVGKIVTGVSASLEFLQQAADCGADLVLVHHGYFWRNEDPSLVGIKRKRLAFLMARDISLVAYHLPLDAHPELGNNVTLGRKLGIVQSGSAGESGLVLYGKLEQAISLADFTKRVDSTLQRPSLVIGDLNKPLKTVAWCTGAGQAYIEEAIRLGVDAFISGEISEQTTHLAKESGVAYIAAGHHATERYGIQALGEHLVKKFAVQHEFLDLYNPV
ncbi:MAG: Nif3-like dinuclear metal center hexameric protein [Methylotenera sp.]|nr:Nif3-like dinuclear metal center hexameric protein [Methylotenera sp.]